MGDTLLILYGSQTGTAQQAAERIGRDATRRSLNPRLFDMNTYNITELVSEHLVLFVCATTGQGDVPDNMKAFWRFLLRKDLPPNSLRNLKFAVLGLGDSGYQKFNYVAKRLRNRLLQLGAAEELVEIGLADDQHDLGADFIVDSWSETLWAKLDVLLQINPSDILPKSELLPPKYNCNLSEVGGNFLEGSCDRKNEAIVLSNSRVTAEDHFQETRLVKFGLNGVHLRYQPGDVVVLRPQNLRENIEQFLELIGLNPDVVVEFENELCPLFIKKLTLISLVRDYLDLQSIPSRYFFEVFSHFAITDLEKEKFQELGSTEGQRDLYEYCYKPKRSCLEVLADFPASVKNIPLSYLLEMIPPIKPRSFSIASAPKAHPNEIHVLVAVVNFKTKLFAPRLGLCSNWLARLAINELVPIELRKGQLDFNQGASNIVLIGPGTGIAPFRSYVLNQLGSESQGNVSLFFGCRNEKKDFYFEKEWENLKKLFVNDFNFFAAFSRDQENKKYVQHVIEENEDFLWASFFEPISRGAKCQIYIAGNSKQMPDNVVDALAAIVGKHSEKVTNANEYVREMTQMETWS